ncbi:MAG: YARHG domain-containing protein [Oscillospiraceae bacterium]|nr:YARHG domain-containing protein [Oscillospiraceae bacterium]
MICKKCGAQIDDNSTECNFCGAVLKGISEDEETTVIDTNAVNEDAEEALPEEALGVDEPDETDALFDENERKRRMQINRLQAEKQQQLDEIEKRRNEKKKKQKRNRIIAIIIIILALGGIGGWIYYISQNQGDTEITVEDNKATEAPLPTVVPDEEETEAPAETEEAATQTPASGTSSGSVSGGSGGSASGGAAGSSGSSSGASGSTSSGSAGTNRAPAASGGSASGGSANSGSVSGGSTSSGSASGGASSSAQGGAAVNTAPAASAAKDYSGVKVGEDGYVFGDSSSRLLTEADLAGKSADELRIARNEIYARHGRKFKDASLQNYFNKCPWYSVNGSYNYSDDAANLNNIEQANAKFILQYEKSHKYI